MMSIGRDREAEQQLVLPSLEFWRLEADIKPFIRCLYKTAWRSRLESEVSLLGLSSERTGLWARMGGILCVAHSGSL
jgi:hypothetical protein